VADIWGFVGSMEKLIRLIRRKPQISTTAKVRGKFTLRERLQETPEPHSRNTIISPGLIEKLPENVFNKFRHRGFRPYFSNPKSAIQNPKLCLNRLFVQTPHGRM
jgi:hypothetical protein